MNPVNFDNLLVGDIEFDHGNPRIRRFLEMYPAPSASQIHLALGSGDDSSSESSFDKLKNSILSSRGIVQPIIVNKTEGRLICIEGNTRLAIYREFIHDKVAGNWTRIPAMVYQDLSEAQIDAIRLQVHLVGPRAWDPYSKAKYLHHLRTQELQPFERIIDFCGGKRRDVQRSIQAYTEIEHYYRPLVDEGAFDVTRFSGFVELQEPKIKDALFHHGYSISDFARWVHEGTIDPLNTVRQLPVVLADQKAHQVFLKHGMRKALATIERPDLAVELKQASLSQLARALSEAVDKLELREVRRMRANPDDGSVRYVMDALAALQGLAEDLNLAN